MGPLDHPKPASMFTDGPSISLPGMFLTASNGPAGAPKASLDVCGWAQERLFPTALNGPTGAWKGGIDVPEWARCGPCKAGIDDRGWAQYLFLEYASDCFEWAHQSLQSQHQPSRVGPVASIRECFRLLRMGLPEHGKAVSMSPNGPSSFFPRMFPENVSDCFEWAHRSMESRYRRSRMGPVVFSREYFRLL